MPNYGRFVQLAEEVRIMFHPYAQLPFEKWFKFLGKLGFMLFVFHILIYLEHHALKC